MVDKSPQLRIIYLDHNFILCTDTKDVIVVVFLNKNIY